MVDLVEIQTAYYMVAATGVLIAAAYYIINTRTTLQTRQAQLFMQVYNKWQDKEFNESKQLVLHEYQCKGYEDYENIMKDKEKVSNLRVVGTFLEGLGVLVKRRLVDVRLVDDMVSGDVIDFWEKYGEAVKEFRKRRGYPQALEWAEYLYGEIRSVAVSQHPELKAKGTSP